MSDRRNSLPLGLKSHKGKASILTLRAAALACVSFGALCAAPALADTAPASPSVDASPTEIVVTAQKREERLKDIPLSVSAVSGESLERRGIKDAIDLAKAVPALGAYPVSPGQNLLSIRGISGFRGDSALVGTYLDEIPLSGGVRLGDGAGLDVQTLDLTRVEVLKGPQGTLFGEGAIGGVIRYISNNPRLDLVSGNVRATYFGTDKGAGSGELYGTLNLPIVTDLLGLRITGTYQQHGGWIENISTGKKNYNSDKLGDVRAKLLFKPTDALNITGLIDIHRLTYDGQNTLSVLPYNKSLFQQSVFPDFPTNGYNDFELYNITANYDLGFATLMSSSSYFNLRVSSAVAWVSQIIPGKGDPSIQGGGWEFLLPPRPGTQSNFSQEFRLTSNPGGPLKWIIGANYKNTSDHYRPSGQPFTDYIKISDDPSVPLIESGTVGHGFTKSRAVAAFADVSYQIFDGFEVGGGLRYFKEKRHKADFDNSDTVLGDQAGNFSKKTYRVFAEYKLSKEVSFYANTATGFRSGGFNDPVSIGYGAPTSYKPENSVFYEGGVKTSIENGKIVFDLAYYNGKYKDQVQANFNFNSAGVGFGYLANAGNATIRGVEASLDLRPIRNLHFGVSGNVPKTRYTKTSPSAPVAVGDPIDFVAKYELMANADYDFKWASDVAGFVSVSSTWKGHQQNTNRDSGVGYVINIGPKLNFVDASVGAEYHGYRFSLFGRNLTNELGILVPQFSGIRPQARPRQLGISLEKQF